MNSAKRTIILAAGLVLTAAYPAFAAVQPEADSAYRWGRWAVLSPAAGGVQPYIAVPAAGADFNARPGDAGFQPDVVAGDTPQPPIVVPNPPGNLPPIGDPRGDLNPPVVVPNPPGATPPGGDPRAAL